MLSIIVAYDKNRVIGKNNKMPWHYPKDLQYFKEQTWGKTVVMGSNTFQSILGYLNKPLPNRHSIVITRHKDKFPEIETYQSIDAFMKIYQNSPEEIFIIGGKTIYEQFIDLVDRLYITHINHEHDGNVYFPKVDFSQFNLIKKEDVDELSFCIYERKVTLSE